MFKKIVILGAILALPLATYGAIKIEAIKWYNYTAQIETQNQGNIFIYKIDDGSNTCYVMTNDYSVARTNGNNFGISCVNNLEDLTSRIDDLQSKVGRIVPVVKK